MTVLFHVSSHDFSSEIKFDLHPGSQNAEGIGVYFSQGEPRWSAAEGAHIEGIGSVIVAEWPDGAQVSGIWYRSKLSTCRKHNRPRTWHSDGKNVRCQVESVDSIDTPDGRRPLIRVSIEMVR